MTELLRRQPHVIAAGIGLLADAAAAQAAQVTRVDWAPPMPGTEADLATVLADPAPLGGQRARRAAHARGAGAARGRGSGRARPGLAAGEFLHAGPPISWDRASGPLRGALMGAAVFEELPAIPTLRGASQTWALLPSSHVITAAPWARWPGVVSPSMWVFVLEDPADGRRAYCSLNEGLGKVLRYGAYSPDGDRAAAVDVRRTRPAAAGRGARARARLTSPRS